MPFTQSKSLRLVDGVWRFIGGLPDSYAHFDETPIPVIDLGRLGEIGSGFIERHAGFFLGVQALENDTGGAANIRNSFDPYSVVSFAGRVISESWVFLMGFSVRTTAASNHTESGAVARLTESNNNQILLYDIRGVATNAIVTGSDAAVLQDYGEPGWYMQSLPLFLPTGTEMRTWTSSSNDLITNHTFLLWGGPMGARPPGVA